MTILKTMITTIATIIIIFLSEMYLCMRSEKQRKILGGEFHAFIVIA